MSYFVPAGATGAAVKATGYVEKLQTSRCKAVSGDRLWCGTCHNPHTVPEPRETAAYFRGKCLGCRRAGRMHARSRLPLLPHAASASHRRQPWRSHRSWNSTHRHREQHRRRRSRSGSLKRFRLPQRHPFDRPRLRAGRSSHGKHSPVVRGDSSPFRGSTRSGNAPHAVADLPPAAETPKEHANATHRHTDSIPARRSSS